MNDVETRTVMSLRTGSKICVLVGLAFVVLAVYFYVVPITSVRTTTGAVFGCGTAFSPATGGFADGVCGDVTDPYRYRAYAALAIGLITLIGGVLMFGVDRREEQRRIPQDLHDADDPRRDDRDWRGDDRDWRGDDRDWRDDEPRTRSDRFAAERDDRPEPSPFRQSRHSHDDDSRPARRWDDHHQPYTDRDDDQSSRRNTDNRYDDRAADRYERRSPGRNDPDER